MKKVLSFLLGIIIISACVPAKKYNELLEKQKVCSEELEKYKNSSLTYEGEAKNYIAKYEALTKQVVRLKADTTLIAQDYRLLQAQCNKINQENKALEAQFALLRQSGEKNTAILQKDLESKNLELQRKQDVLAGLEKELAQKEALLAEREARVNELEEAIKRKDDAQNQLKKRVAAALVGYEKQGLSVVQKNGKIYVSLEAKLLFKSGSTFVEAEGKKALIDLAKVLESEEDLEIIVEGHTDTDALNSKTSPKNNWELSVLRATSVVDIMLSNSEMDPTRLLPAGRSEYLPVDPNDKAKNRRIEIIISPNITELLDIISK